MIFAEAVTDISMYAKPKETVRVAVLANMTEFGRTPLRRRDELAAVGLDMILYGCSADRAMNAAALKVYKVICTEGTQESVLSVMQTRAELYEFLGYYEYEETLERLFAKEKELGGES